MQGVSSTFSGTSQANYRQLATAVQVSWDKTTASGIQYFTIGQSQIGGSDIIKSTGGGTIALANQYKYTTIPASGIVSWNVSMKLDQFPYGLVQRQADIVLNNADERLLPASGTALGPYIESGRPIIIQAGFGGETIPMFTGYSDSPVNDYNTRTTTIHAYDAIDYLNSYNSQATTPILATKADSIIATLLAEAGFSTSQYVLEASLNPAIAYFDPFGLMIGDMIGRLCEAEGAIFFADEAGIMHFWNRQHFSNNSTPVANLTYSNMTTLQQQNSPIINYVQTESSPLALVSGTQQVYSLDQPYYLSAAGTSALNQITNPSFEVSTSGWTGSLNRSTADGYSGSASASGTRMLYDLSSAMTASADGIGYRATAQLYTKAIPGRTVLATLSGVAQSGQVITGTQRYAVSGTNQWRNMSLDASHFNLSYTGTLGSMNTGYTIGAQSSFFGAAQLNGYVYVIAGANTTEGKVYYANLNPTPQATFSLTAPVSSAPSRMGATATASGVYLAGGQIIGAAALSTVYYAKPNANGTISSWISTSTLPAARNEIAMTTANSYLYALGGNDSSGVIKGDVYYAVTNSDGSAGPWSSTSSLTGVRKAGSSVAYNGYVYFVGGLSTASLSSASTTVMVAKQNAGGTLAAFATTTALPAGLGWCKAVALNGYLFVTGGLDTTGATSMKIYSAPLSAVDGTVGAWTATTNMSKGREGHGAVTYQNNVYVMGGFTSVSGTNQDLEFATQQNNGVVLSISGANSFLLDAATTDTADAYFDGDTTSNAAYRYTWAGANHNSFSNRTPIPNYLTVKCSLNAETYSLVQPTASGLNAANIAANQSYYSFSSVSGTGGIYGTDMTSNVSLVNYSVSGTTAFLTFQNNSSNQAYLTNLVLYGQTATASTNISQYYLDQTSINAYRLNPTNNGQIMTISNDYIPNTLAAQSLAQYLVQGFKTPYLKHSTDNFALPQLQFGDCVNLVNSDTGETRIGYVMGITNSLDNDANLKQQLIIQERNLANYFTIGVSNIGGTSQIAP